MAAVRAKLPDYLPQVQSDNGHQSGKSPADLETLKATVAKMVNAASHYKNWEKALQVPGGVALVLGNVCPESSWTKLVGKSGPKFNNIVGRLRDVRLPELAMRYAKLEKVLVEHKVRVLLGDVQDK